MGEYAIHGGESVKIGTCEDMLYLRADQAHLVTPERGSVDPIRHAEALRFRFPWPDEDRLEPGCFDDPFRRLHVGGVTVPDGVDHDPVQFSSNHPKGLLVSFPCPDGPEGKVLIQAAKLSFHKNGYAGPVAISQQRVWNGRLVLVCECGSCGAKYRLPEFEDARPVLDALDRMASNPGTDPWTIAPTLRTIADRITAGYENPPEWVAATASTTVRA